MELEKRSYEKWPDGEIRALLKRFCRGRHQNANALRMMGFTFPLFSFLLAFCRHKSRGSSLQSETLTTTDGSRTFHFTLTSSLKWLKFAKFGCWTFFRGVFSETLTKGETWQGEDDTRRSTGAFLHQSFTRRLESSEEPPCLRWFDPCVLHTCEADGLGGRAGGGGNQPLFTPETQTKHRSAINQRGYISVFSQESRSLL